MRKKTFAPRVNQKKFPDFKRGDGNSEIIID